MNEQQRFTWPWLLAWVMLASMSSGCVSAPRFATGKPWLFPWIARESEAEVDEVSTVSWKCEKCEGRLAQIAEAIENPLVNRVLPRGDSEVEPASYTDYPPVQKPDTAYAVAGPVHAGSELVPRQKMASEIALELKAENERLRAESELTAERLRKFEERLEALEKDVVTARTDARESRESLQKVTQELRDWQEQTVQMYTAVKRSERQVLETLAGLTAVVEQMLSVQQDDYSTAEAPPANGPSRATTAEEHEAAQVTPRLLPVSPVYVSPVRPTSYRFNDG